MTPADLLATLEAEVDGFSEAELADVANFFTLVFGYRYVRTPAEAARAMLGGVPAVLAALPPAGRAQARQMLLAALEDADV